LTIVLLPCRAIVGPDGVPGTPHKLGSAQAEHADVAVRGRRVVVAWKQFDGKSTAILGKLSIDGKRTWREHDFGRTQGTSDPPHLLAATSGIVLVWRTEDEGAVVVPTKKWRTRDEKSDSRFAGLCVGIQFRVDRKDCERRAGPPAEQSR